MLMLKGMSLWNNYFNTLKCFNHTHDLILIPIKLSHQKAQNTNILNKKSNEIQQRIVTWLGHIKCICTRSVQ